MPATRCSSCFQVPTAGLPLPALIVLSGTPANRPGHAHFTDTGFPAPVFRSRRCSVGRA